MDFGTLGGIVFAIGMILAGQAIEGGHVGSILQLTAAMIVFGGTIGAVMVSFPLKEFTRGMKMGVAALSQKKSDLQQIVDQTVDLAGVARRDGVLALEQRLPDLHDEFLKRAVGFIVDGVDATVARDALEAEIMRKFEEGSVGAKVFEAMGGYAPTVGILGAVLGLIHVMENLNDPSKLGGGIATAFVATVYGVGSANLLFLPIATKIKRKLATEKERMVLIAEAALSIQAGLNPRVLREKLLAYAGLHGESSAAAAKE
ncbi:MAG: flagellar motor protein [Polyangia bacterium]|jgi:chemotaxis protein MotA